MRFSAYHLLPASLLLSLATAIQLPDFQPFLSAVSLPFLQDETSQAVSNDTAVQEQQHELLKRQSGGCPNGFRSCSNVGAPQLCCASHAICSADAANVVACCPSGAACTGTIGGYITQGTVNSDGALVGGGVAGATTSNNGAIATSQATTSFQYYTPSPSTTTTGAVGATNSNGFIVVASTVVATPAAGVRQAEIPHLVQAIVQMVQYLPM